MKIIALSDIHSNINFLYLISGELEEADAVVISGDITNFSSIDDATHILSALRRHNTNILAVGGNCDLPEVDEYLHKEGVNLHRRCVEFYGINFAGVCGGVPAVQIDESNSVKEHFRESFKVLETETKGHNPLVLITHQPAKNTLVDGFGRGNEDVAEFIRSRQPILALSGHIHEAVGIDTIGKTVLVNPGPFTKGSYAVIEIEDGRVTDAQIKQA